MSTGLCCMGVTFYFVFFFKQKTAYEMRIRDWSSDVCSSDLPFAIAAMLAAAQCIFRKDPVLKASSLFLAGWLLSGIAAFALLSAAYPHYALVMAPMGCLIVGYAVRGNIPGYAMLAYILNLSLDNIGLYERSEERRVGNDCVRTCRARCSP